jgi:hypothetical protein
MNKKYKLLVIEHHGVPFKNSDCAVLIASGIKHHIVLLKN